MGFNPTDLGGEGSQPPSRPYLGVRLQCAPLEPVGLGFWGGERCGPSQVRIWNSAKLCVCG